MSAPIRSEHSRHAVLMCRIFGTRHGGSVYFDALGRALMESGWRISFVAEQFAGPSEMSAVNGKHLQMNAFFRPAFHSLAGRFFDSIRLLWFLQKERATVLIVQGDLPRLTYILLQFLFPVVFIRQDSILTCPANNRFLTKSRKVCRKAVGLSCLSVHRREKCFGELGFLHQFGRVIYRMRDDVMCRLMRNFVGNSEHILHIHGYGGRVLYPPLSKASVTQTSKRNIKSLAYIGRLEVVKGGEDAINILRILPSDYNLEIMGDGHLLGHLHELAQNLGVAERVHFHGWVDHHRRDEILASCGVLLMPSLCDEAFGMSGMEALAQGTPVVAYDVGGVAEWCRSDCGVLVGCGEVAAAALAVKDLTQNQQGWIKWSEAAKKQAASSPCLDFNKKSLEIVESAVKGRN